MAMTAAAKRCVCVVGLLVYLLALVLFLAGFIGTYWLHVRGTISENYMGLWKACKDGYQFECRSVNLGEMPEWFQAMVALLIIAFIFALVGGATCVVLSVTSAAQSIAGVFILIASCMFATKMEYSKISDGLGWSFTVVAISGAVFTVNGLIIGLLSYKAGCEPKPVPCPCWTRKQQEWKWPVYNV